MEKTTKKPANDENIQVNYETDRTNLHDFGYTRAGNVQGDPKVFGSYLDRILNGDLVQEDYKGLTEGEKNEKRKKIKELDDFLEETRKNNAKYEQDVKAKEKQIEEHRNDLLHIRQKRAENEEELTRESFSSLKFTINLTILIFLTGYLFFFYISAAYKALYKDFESIASGMADGITAGSILPGPVELSEALRYNYLLLLVPFVFYAFGWAFHILVDMKHKGKVAFIVILVCITFIVDMLLALTIHNNTEAAKYIMGMESKRWFQSTTFFIILAFGFLVYILWSILLDSLVREWRKRQVTINLKRIIKHLRKDIKTLEQKIMPVDLIQKEIDHLSDQVNTFVEGNLKGYIDQFTTGWISFLSPDSMKETRNKCLAIKEDFIKKHDIQPGVVKVMKPVKKLKI
jgi:hypothetical protein